MFKMIGKALTGLVLTKDARKAVASPSPKGGKGGAKPVGGARGAAIAQAQAQAKDLVTEERAELIRQAMKVRAAKQTVLAELDDESRGKLVATALKALLNEGRDKDKA